MALLCLFSDLYESICSPETSQHCTTPASDPLSIFCFNFTLEMQSYAMEHEAKCTFKAEK